MYNITMDETALSDSRRVLGKQNVISSPTVALLLAITARTLRLRVLDCVFYFDSDKKRCRRETDCPTDRREQSAVGGASRWDAARGDGSAFYPVQIW